jgi:hypothetical protein
VGGVVKVDLRMEVTRFLLERPAALLSETPLHDLMEQFGRHALEKFAACSECGATTQRVEFLRTYCSDGCASKAGTVSTGGDS